MIQISDNTQQIQPSKIRRMFNKALEYDRVLSFTLGEPDFTASANVVEAGCRAIREGKTKYSENAGLLALRQAIARYLARTEGLSYDPASQIVVTPGAMGALFLALKVLLNPGDEVIVNEPCWTNYIQQIRMCGGVPVSVKTDAQRGFDLDVSAVAETITSKTKAIILNSPCNPTGAVASAETLSQLAKLAQERDLVVLADEVYKHILFDGRTYTGFATLPGMKERTLVIDSLSKTYAMTGWRLGYAAAPDLILKQMLKIHQYAIMCAPTTSQYAAVSALKNGDPDVEMMRESYDQRRRFLLNAFREMGIDCFEPLGAFYTFPNISRFGMTSEEFATKLLMEEKVAVVPGTAFGACGEGFVRISYAYSLKSLKEALSRIERFVKRHDGKAE